MRSISLTIKYLHCLWRALTTCMTLIAFCDTSIPHFHDSLSDEYAWSAPVEGRPKIEKSWRSRDTATSILSFFGPKDICAWTRLSRDTARCADDLLKRVRELVVSNPKDRDVLRRSIRAIAKRCPNLISVVFNKTFDKESDVSRVMRGCRAFQENTKRARARF